MKLTEAIRKYFHPDRKIRFVHLKEKDRKDMPRASQYQSNAKLAEALYNKINK